MLHQPTESDESTARTSRAIYTVPFKVALAQPGDDDNDDYNPDERWVQQYQQAWNRASAKIYSILNGLHDVSLESIVSFVDDSSLSRQQQPSLLSILSARQRLRTGLIIGASPSSSGLLFSALARQLSTGQRADRKDMEGDLNINAHDSNGIRNDEGSEPEPNDDSRRRCRQPSLVSRLTSRDCPNIKTALRSIIAGFIGAAAGSRATMGFDDDDDDENEGGPKIASSGLKSAAIVPEDMHNLLAWYNFTYKRNKAGSAAGSVDSPTLVILLEDLEGIDGKVLAALFETLSHYVARLPIVFLLGVATSAEALHQAVWRGITNTLDIHTFFVEVGMSTFTTLIKELLVDWDPPLSIGPGAYRYLFQTFQDMHQSVDATVNGIQSLYMHHFSMKAVSQVTLPLDASELEDLPDQVFGSVRALRSASMLQLVERANASADADAGDLALLSHIDRCRRDRRRWHRARQIAFELVLTMQDFWDKRTPLEKSLSKLIAGSLGSTADELCNMVLQSTSSKLPLFLQHCLERLRAIPAPQNNDDPAQMQDDEDVDDDQELVRILSTAADELGRISQLPRPTTSGGRSHMHNLVNMNLVGSELMHDKKSLTDADRQFTTLTKQVADQLRDKMRQAFRSSDTLPLHEIWFANDLKPLMRFHPAILSSVQKSFEAADPARRSIEPGQEVNQRAQPSQQQQQKDGQGSQSTADQLKDQSQAKRGGPTSQNKENDTEQGRGSPRAVPSDAVVDDVVVAYRLYRETGKTINLADWYGAFRGAVARVDAGDGDGDGDGGNDGNDNQTRKRIRPDDDNGGGGEDEEHDQDQEREGDRDKKDRRVQARFLRAVGDLAYVGFVLPNSRKAEHVTKSIF